VGHGDGDQPHRCLHHHAGVRALDEALRPRRPHHRADFQRALINEPIVEDTAGIDRTAGMLAPDTWTSWQRSRFDHWWLRFRVLGGIDEQSRAGEAAATMFYLMPLVGLIALLVPRTALPGATSGRAVAAFALFGVVSNYGLMRTPYNVRAVDGVVLPAVLFGVSLAALWWIASRGGVLRRGLLVVASAMFLVVVVKSVAVAGEFGARATWLAGDWRSVAQARNVWVDVGDQLMAEPPLSYWSQPRAPVSIQLARYARACVPASERLLVLWFAPEIYYYADRLMAPRHLVFVQGYQHLGDEQRLTLAKIERHSPPIVFANGDLDSFTREVYPGVVQYVHREYEVAGSMENDGQRYVILVKRGRAARGSYGDERWPCYA
jgi:hypothetical protein